MNTPIFSASDVVSRYTRENALADGVLVDLTRIANAIGFTVPVAIGERAYCSLVAVVDEQPLSCPVNEAHARALLRAAIGAVRNAGPEEESVEFTVARPLGGGAEAELKILSHGGDRGEHVLTILFRDED